MEESSLAEGDDNAEAGQKAEIKNLRISARYKGVKAFDDGQNAEEWKVKSVS